WLKTSDSGMPQWPRSGSRRILEILDDGVELSFFEPLPERFIVRRRTVQRRNLPAHQTQIDRHLAAMMCPVTPRILDHFVTRRLSDDVSARFQSPGRHQVLVSRSGECFARAGC